MIHDSKNGVFPIACGETRDEVHCHLLKGVGVVGCGDAICGSARLMGDDLVLLTRCASFHIVRYPRVHPVPLMVPFYPSYCFISPWVAGRGVVMCPRHQRLSFLG
jgi:hypothetical protein